MAGDAAWLAQVKEDALEPDLPIIDPHHHLWDRNGSRYLLDELLADTQTGHTVIATVFVECDSMFRADGPDDLKPVGETEFVNDVAAQCVSRGIAAQSASGGYGPLRACLGIVSYADLMLGKAAGAVLDAHLAAAPERFRGIRHAAGWDPSPDIKNSHSNPPKGLLGLAKFREGFAELAARNMTFDAWCYHHQIPELTDLARAFPEATIILDHFGGPLGIGPYEGKRDEIFAQWKKDVTELAACKNVYAKLGGINMAVNGFGWHKRDVPPTSDEIVTATRDWYLHSIDVFGPDRCMFESNYPVDKLSVSYGVLWNAFKKMAAGFSATEKADLFAGSAARAYKLSVPGISE